MVRFSNLTNNPNVSILDESGIFTLLEYKIDLSVCSPETAINAYYMSKSNVRKKQILITLNGDEGVILSAGAMQYIAGDVKMTSNVKGVGDLIGKAFSGKVTGESTIKPKYAGNGYIVTEPTYKHLMIEQISRNNGLVISDGMFLACSDRLETKVTSRKSVSSAILGKEGLFNLLIKGDGLAVFESPIPKEELIIVDLENDILKIDGNYAIAWSESLDFTVETSSKNIMTSAVSGEGFVNIYKGTGKVYLSCVEN